MFLSINMEGGWRFPLINFYIKALFGLSTELCYPLSYTNQYLFTLYIMVLSFMIYIQNLAKEQSMLTTMGLLSNQNRKLYRIIFKIS